ncbi:MAG: Uma2 family endonuclease [Pirellulales bacterium]|nr:Uma2 family endonuclease [Pirellulales bacterium]
MGVPEKAVAYIEMEDYLVLENASRFKHEYLEGVVYAIQGEPVRGMAGGSAAHADVIRNVGFALHSRLRGRPCSVKMTEMRLRIDAADAVFYPDVLVHCTPVGDPVTTVELAEARLVVEVLSPSTQQFDRGGKLAAYRKLAGLQHIVLLSSTEQAAWACHRVPADAAWSELAPWPRGTSLPLAGLGLELPWAEVYDGVGV